MAGYKKAEPLYGAPRGNRVMKSKRVTGESAQTILLRHVFLEHCHVKGCKTVVIATKNPDGINKRRFCIDHLSTGGGKREPVSNLLKFSWQ